jgi:hypothetical protein
MLAVCSFRALCENFHFLPENVVGDFGTVEKCLPDPEAAQAGEPKIAGVRHADTNPSPRPLFPLFYQVEIRHRQFLQLRSLAASLHLPRDRPSEGMLIISHPLRGADVRIDIVLLW